MTKYFSSRYSTFTGGFSIFKTNMLSVPVVVRTRRA